MKMKLHDGRSVEAPNIEYPIFDLKPAEYDITASIAAYSETIGTDTFKAIRINGAGENSQAFANLFPSEIPRHCDDDGNIITAACDYQYDSALGLYTFSDQYFSNTTLGTKPDDWGINRYNYYLIYNTTTYVPQTCNTYDNAKVTPTSAYSAIGFTLNYDQSPWSATTIYYLNENSDPRKNMFHLFTCNNGSTFGIGHNLVYQSDGYMHEFLSVGCDPYTGGLMLNSDWQFSPKGNHTNSNNRPRGIMAEVPRYSANPLQNTKSKTINIFVSYVYQDVTYYGVILAIMSDLTDLARPIKMWGVLYDETFWGDSIISGGGSSGNWGDDSVISGGNGTFEAESDTHGNGTGADIGGYVAELNTASMEFMTAGINVFRAKTSVDSASIGAIIGVLFSNDFFTRFATFMYNPLSSVLSAHLLPLKLTSLSGASRPITAGGFNISDKIAALSTNPVLNQFTWYHVGKKSIAIFSDSFADCAPYTSAKLHLPYIGEIDIDVNKIMNGELSVDYVCDSISGNVVAFVWCKDRHGVYTYAYTATGNAAYSYPMFSESQSGAVVGKIVGATGSALVGVATGNPIALMGAAMGGIDAVMQQRNTQVSGTFSGNAGALTACMGDGLVWLEITRPVWANPSGFQALKGLISNLSGTLSDNGEGVAYAGFVKVSDCDLDGIPATDAEKLEIENLLKNGIFVITEE